MVPQLKSQKGQFGQGFGSDLWEAIMEFACVVHHTCEVQLHDGKMQAGTAIMSDGHGSA